MEHTIVPAGAERTAPARVPYRPLFFAALLLLAALAGLCGWLAAQRQTLLSRAGELDRQAGRLEERLEEQEARAGRRRTSLPRPGRSWTRLRTPSPCWRNTPLPRRTAPCPNIPPSAQTSTPRPGRERR